MRVAIRAENLGKQYIVGGAEQVYGSFREMLTGAFTAPMRKYRKLKGEVNDKETFWALKNLDFEVRAGEVIGIIGRNGAGKSTLLKLLGRITSPTEGRIEITGRLGSLLEVGTGFHPELTGRENILLNGTILGMTRQEISAKFDDIVKFAEIERFVDTPVKRYSSGMYVRLAFSVAAHLNTDILLVDEVLAVGDLNFQRRCLGKMQDAAQHGRTVLFVSHNLAAIKALCGRTIFLHDGKIVKQGPTEEIVKMYLDFNVSQSMASAVRLVNAPRVEGGARIRLVRARITNEQGKQTNSFAIWEAFKIEFSVQNPTSPTDATFWLLVRSQDGIVVLSAKQHDVSSAIELKSGETGLSVTITPNGLLPGIYSVALGAYDSDRRQVLDWVDDAIRFEIRKEFLSGRPYDGRLGLASYIYPWEVIGQSNL
jgi:lipopolysaccharide transport system ATP-binding protein